MKTKKMDIIYEDKYLLVVNKPTKLLCISTNKEKEKTLYHEASAYVKKKHKNNKIFIVHRLDKDTSGVVIFAKDVKTKALLQANWNKLAIKRGYIALVHGLIEDKEKCLTDKLVEAKDGMVYISNSKNAKEAVTNIKLLKHIKKYSLINIDIKTGRKHQIRVQLNNYGFPLVGDFKYFKNDHNYFNRLMLHSNEVILIHPITKEKLILNARIPKEFNTLI